ncbi:outer membrane protein assembly factor BamB/Ethanolamine utilization protein EutJ (predicted chaperonin) [Actinoplanes abujensis]|uniref:Outer membrane protein assembly factor BamB/Ethanolamine utilization protein EutJ (Predicted chaperonin) n=1 Tax=Paractinoplanes abujensis TaxID=882441 RepID=A0A7W7CXH4_9ACTN|nr:Hsp70 family protein [Actinoplanes abujensis]MBB4696479.1 outer membrane protein assembly factor BamB/Ethanolamine utilization protein EutJ (predicted chaperonin) [Actinoplanes abujensis]
MTEGFVLGVDLGTSHTVAMLRRPDGRTRPLLFDGRPLLPSAVFRDPGGRLHVGADALRLGHADPARLEPHPKRHVDADTIMLGDASVPVPDLLAALLDAVAREAVATAGFLPPAQVTYPAAWGGPRRAVLVEALGRAGWPAGTPLLPEPVAAARYFAEVLRRPLPVGSSLAVFDFGGGTLDVAVVRHHGPGADYSVTASGGADDLGGLDLDAALVDHLGKSLAGAEPAAWHALTEPATLAQWRARRQFWEDVRGAKEMLSRSSFAPVPVPGVEHAVHLTRDELEATADSLVRRGVAEAGTVIAAAGLQPSELAGLFLVGGSSRVPLVARLLHSELGIAPTVLEQPELPVAEGATLNTPHSATTSSSTAAAGPPTAATGPLTATAAAGPPTPTPTPGVPPAPPPPAARPADDRHYGEPVDPWATGEAAAIAAGGHALPGSPSHPGSPAAFGPPSHEPWLASDNTPHPGSGAPGHHPPGGYSPGPVAPGPDRPRGNRRRWVVATAAALTLVIAAGATTAWAFWPRHPALDFQALSTPVHVTPALPFTSGFHDAVVHGNRAYLASTDNETGRIGVVAIDTDADQPAWSNPDAGTAKAWDTLIALPEAVALISDGDYESGTRELVLLAADTGQELWKRTLGDDDDIWFQGDRALIADRENKQLLGLDITDGREQWKQPDLEGPQPELFGVTTPADLSGPAGATGRPLSPDLGDDPRIVQIGGEDDTARVIDANTGKILAARPDVADTSDDVIAHNGRLVIRKAGDTNRLVAYGLDKLDGADIIYTSPTREARLWRLSPCGDDRVCALEGTGPGDENAQLVAVTIPDGRTAWKTAAPRSDAIIPVGEAVLTAYSADARLVDADGKEIWSGKQAAVRLDDANILELSKPFTGYPDDPALAGRHLGDAPVQLGPLSGVNTGTCSWNTTHLACATDKDFVLIRFAE